MIRTKRVSAITTAVLAIAPALTSTVLPSKLPLGSAAFVMRSDVTMTELTARTVEGRGAVSDRAAPFRLARKAQSSYFADNQMLSTIPIAPRMTLAMAAHPAILAQRKMADCWAVSSAFFSASQSSCSSSARCSGVSIFQC
jgi:hypothetical protein